MKKIIILGIAALLVRLLLIIYFIPIFEKSEITYNLDNLKIYKYLNKINNNRPFQNNIDTQYFSKQDLKDSFVIDAYSKRSLRMNDDEEQNYAIAVNFLIGNNYSIFNDEINNYKKTAHQHSFQVFIYKYFINSKINFDYFVLSFTLINLILFYFSIICFYKLSLNYLNKLLSTISSIFYCLYPSIIFYIGPLFLYENIAISLIIISTYLILKNENYFYIFLAIILATISLLIRFQTIFIWIFLFSIYSINNFIKQKSLKSFLPIIIFFIVTFFAHKPILDKNEILFGEKVLTTSSGISFYIGANKLARGSWDGTGVAVNETKKTIDKNLSDLEISKVYLNTSLSWIKENPFDYVILQIRKLAIYFLPLNYSILPFNWIYNPLNLIVHIGCILFVLRTLYNRKFKYKDFIILSPIFGSLLLSLLFFIGYRWRYYAEPFMIISTFIFFSRSNYLKFFEKKVNKN